MLIKLRGGSTMSERKHSRILEAAFPEGSRNFYKKKIFKTLETVDNVEIVKLGLHKPTCGVMVLPVLLLGTYFNYVVLQDVLKMILEDVVSSRILTRLKKGVIKDLHIHELTKHSENEGDLARKKYILRRAIHLLYYKGIYDDLIIKPNDLMLKIMKKVLPEFHECAAYVNDIKTPMLKNYTFDTTNVIVYFCSYLKYERFIKTLLYSGIDKDTSSLATFLDTSKDALFSAFEMPISTITNDIYVCIDNTKLILNNLYNKKK